MKAEEIALKAVAEIVHPDAQQVLTGAMNVAARHIVNNLRKSGLLLEWRTDVENAPDDGPFICLTRDDALTSHWLNDGRPLLMKGRNPVGKITDYRGVDYEDKDIKLMSVRIRHCLLT